LDSQTSTFTFPAVLGASFREGLTGLAGQLAYEWGRLCHDRSYVATLFSVSWTRTRTSVARSEIGPTRRSQNTRARFSAVGTRPPRSSTSFRLRWSTCSITERSITSLTHLRSAII